MSDTSSIEKPGALQGETVHRYQSGFANEFARMCRNRTVESRRYKVADERIDEDAEPDVG
ncbi:hypothetical protein [Paraburkholderia fungorum]|uniref:hypothetical protein n=1 Tax=Paraburkholderia fungorum TaxID=134537 RepID=UPI002098225C|nr:hypothetical protein [Paraburkholderia fungorum]USX06800.1 hypothetical protein NHH62_18285 [Paraburkholderia fungorum]